MRKLRSCGACLRVGLMCLGGVFSLFALGLVLCWMGWGTDSFQPDVIVVLAGHPERQAYAQALVEDGLAPDILSTLVDPACVRPGQPVNACASGVRSTVDEALWMRHVLAREKIRRVLVVTSSPHAPRAAAVFTTVFCWSGIQIQIATPPTSASSHKLYIRELKKFFPSVGAAMIGRFFPPLYRWINQHVWDDWHLKGYSYGSPASKTSPLSRHRRPAFAGRARKLWRFLDSIRRPDPSKSPHRMAPDAALVSPHPERALLSVSAA